jgi:hypothetical protein
MSNNLEVAESQLTGLENLLEKYGEHMSMDNLKEVNNMLKDIVTLAMEIDAGIASNATVPVDLILRFVVAGNRIRELIVMRLVADSGINNLLAVLAPGITLGKSQLLEVRQILKDFAAQARKDPTNDYCKAMLKLSKMGLGIVKEKLMKSEWRNN